MSIEGKIFRSINKIFILEREALQSIDFAAFLRGWGPFLRIGDFEGQLTIRS